MATAATMAAEGSREDRRDLGPLFIGTIFVGSFLLFLVQPMIARMALPRLGGASAVWNSAMLVYQALLLGGYAYAHALTRLSIRNQSFVHLVLLAAAALLLPIGLSGRALVEGLTPALAVPLLLFASIGPLFFAVSAQAPLIQRWYAAATGGRDPYPLYAASNFGSFAGLISYPLLVEPRMALDGQSTLWTVGYVALVVLTLACAAVLPKAGVDTADAGFSAEPAPTIRRRLWWVVLAFVPSGLMLSTTTYLTTDIVAMPLLWVIPLGLYLLSFTLAFGEGRGVVVSICRLSPVVILAVGGISLQNAPAQPILTMVSILMVLFVVAVTLHAEMYRTRPSPRHLTAFYLCMSVGGALGGIFSGLLAPLVFDWTYEQPILILLAGALVPQAFLLPGAEGLWTAPRSRRLLALAVYTILVGAIAYAAIERPWPWLYDNGAMIGAAAIGVLTLFCIGYKPPFLIGLFAMVMVFGGWDALERSFTPGERMRSYFGIYTVRDSGDTRILAHGTTQHGLQITTKGRERELTTYYSPFSGVGQALFKVPEVFGPAARIGAVGLGTGTLACYTRRGQNWRFYEIDPMMVEVARDGGRFSYLARCNPRVPIVIGDARLSLENQARAAPASLDVLVLDAFSSDAIPMHMLTGEAFAIFGRALQPRGMLLVHISNRFLDLEPVVAVAARAGGWHAARYDDRVPVDSNAYPYVSSSNWILMTRDPAVLAAVTSDPPIDGKWRALRPDPGFAGWSDDYGSILPLLKAFR